MALSWNEIKARAISFSKEWSDTANEDADAKPFLVDFFNVFGINRKRVSTFEHRVKKLDDSDGYIDLLWKGVILIEMKSRGKNLDKAFNQAKEYLHGLKEYELPKFVLVSDFDVFRLHDLEENSVSEFHLRDLVSNVHYFGSLIGYSKKIYKEQDPANIKAAELMGKLHDRLKEIGFTGHPLEVYLVRILFCLFSEDTTIFEKRQFQEYIENRTSEDGSDLASHLQELFQVLNTPLEGRYTNLDEQLSEFPYVNGKLFEEILPIASFDTKLRKALLDCCQIDWSRISPAIFGSMFQSVMNPVERRNLGAHYTSEKNILKLIKPLFLDELYSELESCKGNRSKLLQLQKKLGSLKFLDPACGCGNFLVITYRELRLLEFDILRQLYKGQFATSLEGIIELNVDQFYGIEYEEFPARIAEVALWLIDHQMNLRLSEEFGQYFVRLPLKKAACITIGNALEIDWNSLIKNQPIEIEAENTTITLNEPEAHEYTSVHIQTRNLTIIDERKSESVQLYTSAGFNFILGNPPFIGKSQQNAAQKSDMERIFAGYSGTGVLDYVTAWYLKASRYIQNTRTRVAFVSTNSIVQGEQVGILWNILFNQYGIKIHFAHQSFSWSNEAKGNAAVHVVIIGFANYDIISKRIFTYDDIKGEYHEISTNNINPYLVEGKDITILSRSRVLCGGIPEMSWGNKPVDGGNLILSNEEKNEIVNTEPHINNFIKPLICAKEFLNSEKRWCLWLVGVDPSEIRKSNFLLDRVKRVKQVRESSKDAGARRLAQQPGQFRDIKTYEKYILIPAHSSENRKYIPIGFFGKNDIAHNSCLVVPNASLFHFGMLSSEIHMAWVRYVCGRLESRFRYSKDIVYNNFPWPENPTETQIARIEKLAQDVLDVRTQYPKSSLAVLYDPITMPPALVKAHNELDKAVDLAYRPQPFVSDAKRMEYLFELYEKYTADLFTTKKKEKKKSK
ncbi:MAG TPA: hypothetical protein PKY63_06590 [Bacteroidales bacterium]|nr:hypothetical protein [Bacteroidales bacterium]